MRILMFGTGPFAVPTFQHLLESDHDVPLLVTRPVQNSGKRRKTSDNPMRDAGNSAGLEIFDPASINQPEAVERLKSYSPDLLVVCDYGQILSNACLDVAKFGGINLHGSLLPKYRGAAPINWAIFHGESELGVTVIHMTSRLDGGNMLTKASLELGIDETAEMVEPRLAELGVQPVMHAIEMIERWDGEETLGTPQDPALVTKAPRLNKRDGAIPWQNSAKQIRCQIMAFQPWPGSFCEWLPPGKKTPIRIIVHAASIVESDSQMAPGQVAECSSERLVIQTGQGGLAIEKLQPAGKRPMQTEDFLRGYQPAPGDSFQLKS